MYMMNSLLLLSAAVLVAVHAKMQNVTVKGTTICNKKRMADVLVELWERDTLDPNDLLDSKTTGKEGEFIVKGGQDEFGSIEPFLRITHTCNVKPGCKRVTEFDIQKSKINTVYDMTDSDKGKLCQQFYAEKYKVTINLAVDPNDLLDSKTTGKQGEFIVKGGQDEFGSIEPFLRITHTCNVKPGCKRVTEIDIPESKIGLMYDMTYVTLDIISAVDKEEC
ncbi:unnamed protein product [Cylicocyclus nassatus]|uniref:Uncharacterized protein n=1 Tax=Cylicocyclus nassatus TaxID=53992 RepID=A0AA36H4L6_CYLNA|nr:unnamed protein product [Cylicocyclus nassatus]